MLAFLFLQAGIGYALLSRVSRFCTFSQREVSPAGHLRPVLHVETAFGQFTRGRIVLGEERHPDRHLDATLLYTPLRIIEGQVTRLERERNARMAGLG